MTPRRGQRRPGVAPCATRAGFTLIEMMMVLAILGVIATISIPPVFRILSRPPIVRAMHDLEEACQRARMMAIMTGKTAELAITGGKTDRDPSEMTVRLLPEPAVVGAGGAGDPGVASDAGYGQVSARSDTAAATPFSVKLPEEVGFKSLVINRRDIMGDKEALVRFYPNGTCDEFVATLLSTANEERTMSLEISTARETWVVTR